MARAVKRKKTGKSSAKGQARKAATKAAAKTKAAPSTGPVTLDEARALAQAKQPKLAMRAVRKTAAPPASPAAVGAEREKLRKEQREERARRVREYKATMEIMKRRGARRPRPKASKAADGEPAAKAGGSFEPLQIFAEGDSWFDYPVPFFGGGIIPRLEDRLGVPILNLAKAGDEVRYMLGVEEREVLTKHLTDGSPAGGPWDVLLFSGGGNDIVDNPMALWVKDWNPAMPPAAHIHKARFDAALALVRAGYEDLIALRDQLSPTRNWSFTATTSRSRTAGESAGSVRGCDPRSSYGNFQRARRWRRSSRPCFSNLPRYWLPWPVRRSPSSTDRGRWFRNPAPGTTNFIQRAQDLESLPTFFTSS
jgi:hypothetical protein